MLDRRKRAMLINVLKDPERKNFVKIIYEFSRCSILKREPAGHYFSRLLYKKGMENYMGYLTNREVKSIGKRQKSAEEQTLGAILNNKILFFQYFSQFDLRLPVTLGWNIGHQLTLGRNLYEVEDEKEFRSLLSNALIGSHLWKVFVKPAEGSGGKGCGFLSLDRLEGGMDGFPDLLQGSYVFQEPVIQHQVLSAVYPFSLNTIRMNTFIDASQNPKLISAFIRFGTKQNQVDNVSAGGFFVSIDMHSGELASRGFQLLERGGKTFSCHPDTKFFFRGLKLPYFKQTKELVLEAARLLPYRLTGWDIGITPDGPVLIEGNSSSHVYASDMAYGGYLNHPFFQEIINEFSGKRPAGRRRRG